MNEVISNYKNKARQVSFFFFRNQWQIQDFPDGGRGNPQGQGANLSCGQIFLENCMKMKEIGPGGPRPWCPLAR